ncbi:MAG: AbrB/MazE/SpoVT family DNA-binding domain-containing protein [Clostridia bacterium]|nr:AbrB/MazE/SpoVT family DNA-binding domain-containing protein [Clostridia bacterium]
MKATGIVRRVDVLGRVVIPKEIRKIFNVSEGDPIEIFTEKDGIILKKYSPLSNMDGLGDEITYALFAKTGKCVYLTDKDEFLSASGNCVKDLLGKPISQKISRLISQKQTLICNFDDGQTIIPLENDEGFGYYNQLVIPIIFEDEGVGSIIMCSRNRQDQISSKDVDLAELSRTVLARRFK